MKETSILKNLAIPRPYSRNNCVKDLKSIDTECINMLKTVDINNRLENKVMHNELFGYDKRTFNETPTPVTSKSRIIVQNNSRKSIILRRRRETKPKGSIIENKNITVKADQTPKTNLNSKFMASVLQNSCTRSKEDVSLAREPFINKINKEIIQKDNGQINHKRRNIINKFKQKALETAYKSINKQRISENKKKYKFIIYLKQLNNLEKKNSNKRSLNADQFTKFLNDSPIYKNKVIGTSSGKKRYSAQNEYQNLESSTVLGFKGADEQKLSIMVSSLGGLKSPKQIHDVYEMNSKVNNQPKLIFRRTKQIDFTNIKGNRYKVNRRSCDEKLIQQGVFGILSRTKEKCILPKTSQPKLN